MPDVAYMVSVIMSDVEKEYQEELRHEELTTSADQDTPKKPKIKVKKTKFLKRRLLRKMSKATTSAGQPAPETTPGSAGGSITGTLEFKMDPMTDVAQSIGNE